jgi:hypothetical protein
VLASQIRALEMAIAALLAADPLRQTWIRLFAPSRRGRPYRGSADRSVGFVKS